MTDEPSESLETISFEEVWSHPRPWPQDILQALTEADWRRLLAAVATEARAKHGTSSRKQRAAGNRLAKATKRRLVKLRRGVRPDAPPFRIWPYQFHPSELLDGICRGRKDLWIEPKKRKKSDSITTDVFSFIDEPAKTLEVLEKIARADAQAYNVRLNFNVKHCVDVGPLVVLGLMRRRMIKGVFTGGDIFPPFRTAIEAVGLRSFLLMNPFKQSTPAVELWPFKLTERDFGRHPQQTHLALRPSTMLFVADHFVESIDDWLLAACRKKATDGEEYTLSLTEEAKGWVSMTVTELLENGERHSRPDNPEQGGWWIAGFMARRQHPTGEFYYECHLAIVSLGSSIGDSLSKCEDPVADEIITSYLKTHAGITRTASGIELLRTVCAIQHGISRLSQEKTRGGVGLWRMIEFVNRIGQTGDSRVLPKIAILSGNSYISISHPFVPPVGGNKQRLWFNEGNDPNVPPVSSHVFTVPQRFPGTVVTMRFVLDANALDRDAKPVRGSVREDDASTRS